MADGLASLLASGYPTLPAETQALTAENALAVAQDPSRWQGQGIFGGLARQMALGQAQSQLQSAVPQIVAAHNAALPDLAAAYASDNPFQWAAANPDASPLARAMVLTQTPGQVAQAKDLMSQAGYRSVLAQLQGLMVKMRLGAFTGGMSGYAPLPGAGAARAPGAASPGVAGAGLPTNLALGSGRYPAVAGTGSEAAAPATPAEGAAPAAAGLSQIPPAGPQRMAWLARLTPAQKAAVLARLPPGGAAPAAPALAP